MMAESKVKFTPGPWKIFIDNGTIYVDPDICSMEPKSEAEKSVWTANATLIAAAPEMYNVLDKIVHQCTIYGSHISLSSFIAAKKALQKARGEE